jgi:hypothetical protein
VPAAALALLGACNGLLDVSMNTQAAAVERRAGRAIMSSFHALFSLGGIAGALLAAGAMWAGMGDVAHVAAAGLVALAAVTVALTRLVPARPGPAEARAARVRPSRSLAGLGILATRVATPRRPSWGARWSASGRERHPGALQRGGPRARCGARAGTVGRRDDRYLGFLAGPPLIGGVAEAAGLAVGLGLVSGACAVVAVGAGVLPEP